MIIRKNWLRLLSLALFVLLFASCGGGGSTTVQTTSAVIPATTKVLDNNSLNALSAVSPDGSQITFTGTTPQIDSLAVGDVIAGGVSSSAPSGVLKKVASINKTGNQVVVGTTDTTIEDSIQKGSWSVTQSLSSNDTVQAVGLAKGVRLNQLTSLGKFNVSINNVVLYDNDGNTNTTNDQITANGSITVEPSYTFSGDVDNFKLKKLTFTNTTKETCSITLSSNASLVNFDKSIEIAKYNMPTVTIWVGGFPIVITPVLTVNVGLNGNVSVGISTGIVQDATYTNGLTYDDGNGWSTIKDQSKSFTFTPPTLTAAATAKCYAGPKLELLLYGSAGPYATADGYLELDANPSNNPWWQLYGGIEARAGVELKIVSHLIASYSANIFDERVLIAQADGGFTPPPQSSYTVSGRVVLNGAGLSGVTVTLSGSGSSSTVTDSNGGYTFANAANGSYTLMPSLAGYSFSPTSVNVTVNNGNSAVQDIIATANSNPGGGGVPSSQRIAAGAIHTVALKNDGTVWACGNNTSGELGDGTTTNRYTPVKVSGLSGIIAIAAGNNHTVALKNDGTVWTWGANWGGQLGDGTTTDRYAPIQVSGLSGIIAIAAGFSHTAALKNDGTLWVWDYNEACSLSRGTVSPQNSPVQVSGLSGITAIASGGYYTVAIKNDGSVWELGRSYYGQLTNRDTPVQVSELSGITAISTGMWGGTAVNHTLALKNDGTVWAWGGNQTGELGDGTTTNRYPPVQVSGLSGIIAISAGGGSNIALKNDGTAWAWGYNGAGQFGNGTTTNSSTPVQVSGISGITNIATGGNHSIALKNDGTLWAWGDNQSGELGDGTTTWRFTPVQVSGFSITASSTTGGGSWSEVLP